MHPQHHVAVVIPQERGAVVQPRQVGGPRGVTQHLSAEPPLDRRLAGEREPGHTGLHLVRGDSQLAGQAGLTLEPGLQLGAGQGARRRLRTQLARRDDPELAQGARGDLALNHLAGSRALIERAVAADHPLPHERALGHVVGIGLGKLAHLVGDLLQRLVEHPLRHRHVRRQLARLLAGCLLEQDRGVVVVVQPLPRLGRREPRSVEADRLQDHRVIALDAVDEVHPRAAGIVHPPETVESIGGHQPRGVLIRVGAALLAFNLRHAGS